MKRNCRLMTVDDIRELLSTRDGIDCKEAEIRENGDFDANTWSDGRFGNWQTFPANQIAKEIDLPLWEVVVTVAPNGYNEYAILFYAE